MTEKGTEIEMEAGMEIVVEIGGVKYRIEIKKVL